ncbi:Uncharacterised protein [Vibrio cholerae]|nr:Uncharacterised protein [Vibrio cholerae]
MGYFIRLACCRSFGKVSRRSIRLSTWSMRSATVSLACRMWIS